MPRKPTEKVIEHRITLGTYERQIFSDAVTSYNFKNVSTPIVSALSDVSFVLLIGAAIGLFLDRVLPDDWRSVTEFLIGQDLSDWLEVQRCWNWGYCRFICWQSCIRGCPRLSSG